MKIISLKIERLYGYLNKTIVFNNNINLLVGINGSGKTSILNVLNWVLKPSFADLAVTEFSLVEIDFILEKQEFKIKAYQTDKALIIELNNISEEKQIGILDIAFRIHPKQITRDENLRNAMTEHYSNLSPTNQSEIEVWNFLHSKIPYPVIIGLDRKLYTNENDPVQIIEETNGKRRVIRRVSSNSKTPIDKVKDLTNREFSVYRSRIVDLNANLNEKIMLSAFNEIYTEEDLNNLDNTSIPEEQIKNLQEKIRIYFQENILQKRRRLPNVKHEQITKKIDNYFDHLTKVISQAKGKKNDNRITLLYLANINQFKKINELLQEFEDFENKSKKYYSDIKDYIDTINQFFNDCAKELTFNKVTGELKYNVLDQECKVIERYRDIRTLSSGEKQILILFTYLKFNSKNSKIFIIDEPELSLYPKWQEDFLSAVEKLMPSSAQIIIATHSPNIVGDNKEYCKVLLPYN